MWSRTRVILFTQLFILIALTAIASFVSPYFLTFQNAMNILRQASLIVIPAVGQAVVIIAGGFDLSVGAIFALGAVSSALLFKLGAPIYIWVPFGLLCGVAAGFINGIMVSRVKLPPFVATYGMMFALWGVSMLLLHGDYIIGFPEIFQVIGKGTLGFHPNFQVPMPFLMAVGLALIVDAIMSFTTFGRSVYAIGSNRVAARLSGINVANVQLLTFMLCGLTAALGGLVLMARMNAAEMRMGDEFLLPVVAAVVLGGCSLEGGEGSVWGTFVGAIILVAVTNVLTLAGAPDYWRDAVNGGVIIFAVILDIGVRRFLARRLNVRSKELPTRGKPSAAPAE